MVNQQKNTLDKAQVLKLLEENEQLKLLLEQQSLQIETRYKSFTHELAGAIQVLILSLDSIEHNPNTDVKNNLERMRRASKNMVKILSDLREERKKKSPEILK